jgi:hypothetical protein
VKRRTATQKRGLLLFAGKQIATIDSCSMDKPFDACTFQSRLDNALPVEQSGENQHGNSAECVLVKTRQRRTEGEG